MPKFTPQRFEQILAKMLARIVSRTDLSDVSDSSVIKHLLAAAARQDDEQYYQMTLLLALFSIDTATGDDLDERAKDIQPGSLARIAAAKATGQVQFSRTGTVGTVNIPIGTKLKTAGGVIFVTTTLGTINNTFSTSNLVSAVAELPGSNGNVAGATIVKFVSKPAGVDSVTNPSAFSSGADKETDDAFRERLKAFIRSLPRSTISAIESGVLGKSDTGTGATIRYSKVIEDPVLRGEVTLYIDDGTGSIESTTAVVAENITEGLSGPPPDSAVGGEKELFTNFKPIKKSAGFTLSSSTRGALTETTHYTINEADGQITFNPALAAAEVITGSYTYFKGLIQLAQKVVDGDKLDRTTYPGLRAAGVRVLVLPPQVLLQTVNIALVVEDGFDQATAIASVKQAIKDYINTLPVGSDLIRFELARRVLGVAGVFDAIITTPSANVPILDTQLARTTDVNITVT